MFQRLKALFEKKPPPEPVEFRHPDLGLLTLDAEFWGGNVHRDGRDISFFIGGTEASPDSALMDAMKKCLDRFTQLESRALQFLCPPEAPVKPSEFTLQSVDFLLPDKPDHFTLTFVLDGDPHAIWRVEFESWQPKHSGRDD